jgi:predicted dehydrogenase
MSYQREYERTLRVGVVGVGSHAYRNILPALHYLPVTLTGLCDINAELVKRTAQQYGVPAFVDASEMYSTAGLDAALICVGPKQHAQLATEALRAGLHVWIEKPPGVRAADVEAIMAHAGDRTCAVGFKKAYLPAVRKARELAAGSDFGQLHSLLAVYPMTIPRDGADVLAGGHITNWLANGCHPLSAMLALGGDVSTIRTVRGPGEQAHGAVHLQYTSGAIGTFYLAGGSPNGRPAERYELLGDRRAITIDDSVKVTYDRGIPFDYASQRDFTFPGTDTGSVVWTLEHRLATLENMSLFVQGIVDELLDFCTCALDGRTTPLCDLQFALQVMRIYEAALLSSGDTVPIAVHSTEGMPQ